MTIQLHELVPVEQIIDQNPTYFDELITSAEAAQMLSITQGALNTMRNRPPRGGRKPDNGPDFHIVGKSIKYTRRDVLNWIASKKVAA